MGEPALGLVELWSFDLNHGLGRPGVPLHLRPLHRLFGDDGDYERLLAAACAAVVERAALHRAVDAGSPSTTAAIHRF